MKKPVYLGVSMLEIKSIVVYEYWYDYVRLNYYYMGTDSFIGYIKTEDICADIAKGV